jgi:hypothetical protein
MIEEVSALYRAANDKRKRNPNWSLELDMLLPSCMIQKLCSNRKTVHLALEMLTDIDILGENGTKLGLCVEVVRALCWFKYFDAAKKLIFKMIADSPLPRPSGPVFNHIIRGYFFAG